MGTMQTKMISPCIPVIYPVISMKKKTNFPGDSDESTNSDLVAIIESDAAVCCSRIAQTKIEMLVKI